MNVSGSLVTLSTEYIGELTSSNNVDSYETSRNINKKSTNERRKYLVINVNILRPEQTN